MGWFGPRGLASVVFTLVSVETLQHSGAAFDALVEVATWTVLLSVMAHGLSAGPMARAYGRGCRASVISRNWRRRPSLGTGDNSAPVDE